MSYEAVVLCCRSYPYPVSYFMGSELETTVLYFMGSDMAVLCCLSYPYPVSYFTGSGTEIYNEILIDLTSKR